MKRHILIVISIIFVALLSVSIASHTVEFEYIPGDMDGDRDIDFNDFILFASEFGKPVEDLTVKRVSIDVPPSTVLSDEIEYIMHVRHAAGSILGYWAIYRWGQPDNGPEGWVHNSVFNFNNFRWRHDNDTTYVWGKPADRHWINYPYGYPPSVYAVTGNEDYYVDPEIAVYLYRKGGDWWNRYRFKLRYKYMRLTFRLDQGINDDATEQLGYEAIEILPTILSGRYKLSKLHGYTTIDTSKIKMERVTREYWLGWGARGKLRRAAGR